MKQLFYEGRFSFKSKHEICNDKSYINKVVEMTDGSWSEEFTGELNSCKYIFKRQQISSNKTDIFKVDSNSNCEEKIGEIEIKIRNWRSWRSEALISIYQQIYNYEFTNIWNTKYQITNVNKNILINGENKTSKDNINIHSELNELKEFDKIITFENRQINPSEIIDILSLSSIYIYNYCR